jgi:hypothetical protein
VSRDVRKLIGKLYPTVQKIREENFFSGCGSSLTPQDLAAAIAMSPNDFSRAVFLAVNWPEAVCPESVKAQLTMELNEEWYRRELRFQLLFTQSLSQPVPPRELETSSVNRWRKCPRTYRGIAATCLEEVRSSETCPACFAEPGLVEECLTCEGAGVVVRSASWRASLIGVHRKTFTTHWLRQYEWLLKKTLQAEQRFGTALAKALT